MPLYIKENIENVGTFAIWKLAESEEKLLLLKNLSEKEKKYFSSLKNSNRRKEWLTVRILLEELVGKNFLLDYLPNGKPVLQKPKLFLSISHSKDFVAVFVSQNKEIGIDIEKNRENIEQLKNKFLLSEELQQINNINLLHIYWGAKEAMYKMYSFCSPLLTEHLFVSCVDYQKCTAIGKIKKRDFNKIVNIIFWQIEDNTLVCCFEN
jgi:4'-phosphopantetheinyl transferase EntD